MFNKLFKHVQSLNTKWVIVAVIMSFAVLSSLFAPIVFADSEKVDSSTRLVTFYDNDKETTILTKSRTVREALAASQIKLAPRDIISPNIGKELSKGLNIVSIKRARPVSVMDSEGVRSRIVTASTDSAEIAREAGMDIKANDTHSMTNSIKFMSSGGVGEEMTIGRAKTVSLLIYGKPFELRTQKNRVSDMLKEAGIKLSKDDTVSKKLDDPVVDNMKIQIWRNGIQTIEQDEDVKFPTEVINDPSKKLGYDEVRQAGHVGKKKVLYQLDMRDGIEVNRKVISEIITVPAIKEVRVRGTKIQLPPGSHQDWLRMAGVSEENFGYAEFLVSHESGWRVNARNPSGAYGLPQALPGSKMSTAGPDWETNPITQLRWMKSYVNRYGGWRGAYEHWQRHHWY